jgi:hypothetical protein
MMVVTSKRYQVPTFDGDMIRILSRLRGREPLYVKKCKYVDCDTDGVYIMDADSHTFVPTDSTLRKLGDDAKLG